MSAGYTIPMAQALLSDGRAPEVARMLAPLLEQADPADVAAAPDDHLMLRCLLARIRLLEQQDPRGARSLLEAASERRIRASARPHARAEWAVWMGWCELLDDSGNGPAAAAVHFSVAAGLSGLRIVPETALWCNLGRAIAAEKTGAPRLAGVYAEMARRVQSALRAAQADVWLEHVISLVLPPAQPATDVIGLHAAVQKAVSVAFTAAVDDQSYLVIGERGTGRRHLARAVHARLGGRDDRFHLFRSGGGSGRPLDEALTQALEDEARPTLCLHDVEELPRSTQRMAAAAAKAGRAHVVCTSTRDFPTLVDGGHLEDVLLQSIAPAQVHLPPLRSRSGDVELLVHYFLRVLRRSPGLPPAVTEDAMTLLCRYTWPGNIRQLRNEVERALVHVQSEPAPVIRGSVLSPEVRGNATGTGTSPGEEKDLEQILSQTEKAVIESVLVQTGGQVTAAADALGLTRQGLYKKMKRLGVDPTRHQNGAGDARIEAATREDAEYA